MTKLTVDELRAEFPVVKSCTYLDSAYWGPYPQRTADAIADFVRKRSETPYPFGRAEEDRVFVDSVRSKMADVLNVTADEIWFPKGTTDGISTVANALLSPGDEIIVGGLDHPADYAIWSNLAERGMIVTVAPQRNGRMDPEDIERAITPRTRAIGLCLVNTYNGYRQDLDALSRVAGDHGLYLFLDAIQGMGHLAIDVADTNVTMMSAGAYKWLCSPEGLGVSYVNKDVIEDIIPHNVHFYGLEPRQTDWESFIHQVFEYGASDSGPQRIPAGTLDYPDTAVRMEVSPSIIALIGLNQMADVILEFGGIEAVEKRVLSLSAQLRITAQEHGHSVLSPPEPEGMTGINAIATSSAEGFQDYAQERGIYLRARPASPIAQDSVRVTPHFFNNQDDIDTLVDALDEFRDR